MKVIQIKSKNNSICIKEKIKQKMLVTTILILGTLVGFWLLFKSIDWFEKI